MPHSSRRGRGLDISEFATSSRRHAPSTARVPACSSNTADMIFSVAACVSYVSRFMTLYPGDVLTTGTPQGVGLGRKPPRYVASGNTMRLGITGPGEQFQTIRG
jgi:2-keto-4-pentenoate hydratase/2-oxohepta-3-ene-1,7-dioic acid hydratase in catechol pathway